MMLCTLIAIVTSGCSSTNISQLADKLKGDNSTIVHNINTIYGTSKFIRSNPGTNQTVSIAPDGTVTITSR